MHISLTDDADADQQPTIDIPESFMLQFLEQFRPADTPGERSFQFESPHHTGQIIIRQSQELLQLTLYHLPKPAQPKRP